ncbi:UDP-N-acetylglucosamine--undecaprenyl-phosphate N-acetylglucosaminephosphotransferase [Thorsellia anophelis]|uniref:Undecaprenyl-phosphate alpha-N-acetylglucosaminyl 1-phosphate transferase n=1 Tax=Thorsellia anophelis DSM 18579 TaxID=1123402 RepID=A0A1H9ZGQ1_9GAMM|nr:UDP-N-acetylglucosamine--undecaprenyl-phosphate N-acetylglucosaminephosphotransferase [Thorsellia anophelis]SES80721.1 UDP-GlcNAc:undecaprenyl-phosphate GlcNAc-1-phosphate transferase [Thorsellia anophelis DSM 18579]
MFFELIVLFIFSLAFLFLARKVAKKIGLVDKPNFRKKHQGAIPLVGGISVFAGIIFLYLYSTLLNTIPHFSIYLSLAGLLVLVGAIDDRFDISVKFRASIQAVVAIVMMYYAGISLETFGNVFGFFEFKLGYFGYLITLLAVWGAINAFNMVDGIDGLLGGLSCVTFAALGILLYQDEQYALSLWAFAMIAAILPYIMLNLGLLGKRYKVFMGDAGSTLIGFTALWMLLVSSQPLGMLEQTNNKVIYPVTALWLIAIPLMDMIAIMYRRIKKGLSPFSADRQHIHHLIMRAGFTSRQAFALITLAAAVLALIGVLGEELAFVPEWFMLLLFFGAFFIYGICIKRAWKVARYIKRLKRRLGKKHS